MCPGHTSLQLLVGDGLVRIPLLHFTAEGTGKTTQKGGVLKRLPGPHSRPSPIRSPPLRVKQRLLLALASGCLGLVEGSCVRDEQLQNCPEREAEG